MDKNKELQRKQEDEAFAHGLCWVGGAVLVECFLLLINRYFFQFYSDELVMAEVAYHVLRVTFVVAPVVFLIAAVKALLDFKKTGAVSHVLEGAMGLSGALSLSASMCMIYNAEGCTMMMLFIPAAGALAFTFFLYQRDFFYSAALSGMAGMVLWMLWHKGGSNTVVGYIGAAKVVVFSAVFIWLASLLKKHDGAISLLGHKVTILPKDASYAVIYITVALASVAVLLGAVLGGYVAYYLIYCMVAWIFALLVYYTVRML